MELDILLFIPTIVVSFIDRIWKSPNRDIPISSAFQSLQKVYAHYRTTQIYLHPSYFFQFQHRFVTLYFPSFSRHKTAPSIHWRSHAVSHRIYRHCTVFCAQLLYGSLYSQWCYCIRYSCLFHSKICPGSFNFSLYGKPDSYTAKSFGYSSQTA